MTKIWVSPRIWGIGELVDDLKMQEVSNALDWLKDRPFDQKVVANTGANFTQAVTGLGNWFAVDDAAFTLNIGTANANERVRVSLDFIFSTTGALGTYIFWDVYVDNTYFGSTGTASSPQSGLGLHYSVGAAGTQQHVNFEAFITILAAGDHTLKLRMGGSNTTTLTVYKSSAATAIRFAALDI